MTKINGGQTLGNEYLVDGITTNRAENGSGGFDGISPSVEAIQEFRISISALPPTSAGPPGESPTLTRVMERITITGPFMIFTRMRRWTGTTGSTIIFWRRTPLRQQPSGARPTPRTIMASLWAAPFAFLTSTMGRIRHSSFSDGNSFAIIPAQPSPASCRLRIFAARLIPTSISQASSAGRSPVSPESLHRRRHSDVLWPDIRSAQRIQGRQ